jgi:hypothetical protein
MTVNAKIAAIIGNQPPSTTFNKLPEVLLSRETLTAKDIEDFIDC